MPVSLRVSGAWKGLTDAKVYVNGQWRTVRTIRVYKDGAWRTAYTVTSGMTAAADPFETFNDEASAKPTRVFSDPITARVSGGVAPFSYSWTVIEGSGVTFSTQTNATTTISKVLFNATETIVLRCTVTDAAGSTATCDALATLSHSDFT